jgi:hypothetical protein
MCVQWDLDPMQAKALHRPQLRCDQQAAYGATPNCDALAYRRGCDPGTNART